MGEKKRGEEERASSLAFRRSIGVILRRRKNARYTKKRRRRGKEKALRQINKNGRKEGRGRSLDGGRGRLSLVGGRGREGTFNVRVK